MPKLVEKGCLDLVHCLEGAETTISGPEKVARLKKGAQQGRYVLLGPEDLELLMRDPDRIPESWKAKINEKTVQVYFHRETKVDEATGEERYRFLCWSGIRWQFGAATVDSAQSIHTPSVVIKLK